MMTPNPYGTPASSARRPPREPDDKADPVEGALERGFGKAALLFLAIGANAGLSVYMAYITSHFWRWFVEPATGHAFPLPILRAAGVVLLLRYFLVYRLPDRRLASGLEASLKYSPTERIVLTAWMATICWAMGWLLHVADLWLGW